MSAIAGACGDRIGDAGALLDRMVESLCYVDEPRVDRFVRERVVLARIEPSIANRQPQPATSADGARRLVFAGELFEADALRAELASQGRRLAPDGGDAELALALFEERGEEGLAALNGSFAFALHDDRAKELVLVSDRFSSRPLFHAMGAASRSTTCSGPGTTTRASSSGWSTSGAASTPSTTDTRSAWFPGFATAAM